MSSLGCVGAAGDASKSDDPGVARSGELFGNNTKRRGDQRLSLDPVVQRSRLQADGVQSESATIRPLRFGRFPERLFRGAIPIRERRMRFQLEPSLRVASAYLVLEASAASRVLL